MSAKPGGLSLSDHLTIQWFSNIAVLHFPSFHQLIWFSAMPLLIKKTTKIRPNFNVYILVCVNAWSWPGQTALFIAGLWSSLSIAGLSNYPTRITDHQCSTSFFLAEVTDKINPWNSRWPWVFFPSIKAPSHPSYTHTGFFNYFARLDIFSGLCGCRQTVLNDIMSVQFLLHLSWQNNFEYIKLTEFNIKHLP